VPCGVSEHGVTSLAALGIPATMAQADAALHTAWGEVFGTAAELAVPACAAPASPVPTDA
jgi:lipoate-protein ligase B